MGFSAGGHLCSMAATMHEPGNAEAADPIERVSSRPDFAALIYPVIQFDKPYTHQGSRRNLLGDKADDAELVAKLSTASAVDKNTSPCFLMHTTADKGVPPENSIDFYLALRRAEVPAALQLFEKGPHGVGLGRPGTAVAAWPELFAAWLGERGIL
jgi:dipeptidyl aminopeptidase/acylaminoacyl peptidase